MKRIVFLIGQLEIPETNHSQINICHELLLFFRLQNFTKTTVDWVIQKFNNLLGTLSKYHVDILLLVVEMV